LETLETLETLEIGAYITSQTSGKGLIAQTDQNVVSRKTVAEGSDVSWSEGKPSCLINHIHPVFLFQVLLRTLVIILRT
jgi:hypothetical protein